MFHYDFDLPIKPGKHTHTHTITIIWHHKIIFHGYIKEKYERKEEKRRRKMEIKSKLYQWLYAFWLVVWILLGLKGRCLNFSDINPSLSAGLRAYAFLSFESALPLSFLIFYFIFKAKSPFCEESYKPPTSEANVRMRKRFSKHRIPIYSLRAPGKKLLIMVYYTAN